MATINGGFVTRLVPLTTFTFTNLDVNQSQDVVAQRHFTATSLTEGHVLVRLHTGSVLSAGTSIKVAAKSDGYAFDDPTADFLMVQGSVTFTSADVLPAFKIIPITFFGRLLQADITANQTSPSAALVAVLSIDVVLKGGDPAALDVRPNEGRGYWTE